MRPKQLRLISWGIILYLLLAFVWWSVLLYTKNRDAFQAKAELLKVVLLAKGDIQDINAFESNAAYRDLKSRYDRQALMILGEVLVLMITLVAGIWFINRGYNREVNTAQAQRNFLLSITHELKSPLAGIRLVLDTIRKRELNQDQKLQLTHNALAETKRLTSLVEDLLLAAKVETGYQPNMEIIDLPELIEQVAEVVRNNHPGRTILLDLQVDELHLHLDKTGMTSVLVNLLENGIKYSPDPAPLTVQLYQSDLHWIVAVKDHGNGVPDGLKKKIFQKFYRVGDEDTRATKGTGLGLYIVDQLVKAHHGQVKVENNHPNGSVFSVWLPLRLATTPPLITP